jgi:hypothetical protein
VKTRHFRFILLVTALACVSGPDLTYPTPPTPPPPPSPGPAPSPSPIADVRLSDIVISSLPTPFYRFEYDSSGRVTVAAFAGGLLTYEVRYDGSRIAAMQGTLFPGERLDYSYDGRGKVSMVTYADGAGAVYVRVHLAYTGDRLVKLERERFIEGRFLSDKRMSFVYDASGNLSELTDERLPFPGQTEATFVDRFERYDTGTNVDGFSLLHNEFFDHLVLLPAVRLQLGNPAVVTRSGSGSNYRINYTYTYDSEQRPLTKHGEGTFLSGAASGSRFETSAVFSYE